jgi:hypothetical protein
LTFLDEPVAGQLFWRVVSQTVEFTAADLARLAGA